MLTTLKSKITNDVYFKEALEFAVEQVSEAGDDIKDAFLDDPEMMIVGAENDPEIKKLIDAIPEDEDADEISEKDIEEMIENFIPVATLLEDLDASAEDGTFGDEDDLDTKKETDTETDTGDEQDTIEDADDKAPVKENDTFSDIVFEEVGEVLEDVNATDGELEDDPDLGDDTSVKENNTFADIVFEEVGEVLDDVDDSDDELDDDTVTEGVEDSAEDGDFGDDDEDSTDEELTDIDLESFCEVND